MLVHVAPRNVERDAALLGVFDEIVLALLEALALPRLDRSLAQRLRGVGNDEAVVDPDHAAEATARRASAQRRIERKERGRGILISDIAIRAMQLGRKAPNARLRHFTLRQHINVRSAVADAKPRLEGVDDAGALGTADAHTIGDDIENAIAPCMDACVTLSLEERQNFFLRKILG